MKKGFILITTILIFFIAVSLAVTIISYTAVTQRKTAKHFSKTVEYHQQQAARSQALWLEKNQ